MIIPEAINIVSKRFQQEQIEQRVSKPIRVMINVELVQLPQIMSQSPTINITTVIPAHSFSFPSLFCLALFTSGSDYGASNC